MQVYWIKKSTLSPLVSSGLSYTPRAEKGELSYSIGNEDSYRPFTKAMRELLEPYKEQMQTDDMKYEDCGGTLGFHS